MIEDRSKNILQTQSCCPLSKYLLLTEFEGRTVSYGPSFFPFDLWPKREARGAQIEGEKTRIRNLQYGPRKLG